MKSHSKTALFFVLLFTFAGCKNEPAPPPPVVSVPTISQTAAVSQVQKSSEPAKTAPVATNWLAKLTQQSNQVEYRERAQNIWKPAEIDLTFLKFDALQTKGSSTAEVVYLSGSTLDVKENTLIIFDEDPGQKKKTEDRVIIKSGQLTGKTKTELWVFTDAGLVQIKAKKKVAEARVVVKKDNAVDIKVKSGTAQVVYKKSGEFTRLEVNENADATIKASSEILKPDELVAAQATAKAPTQANLEVEFPADNALVKESEIEVRGRVTGAGAKLLINGELVQVDDSLNFSKKINLQPGTNLLVFQLIRSDSSVKFVKRSVRYQAQ